MKSILQKYADKTVSCGLSFAQSVHKNLPVLLFAILLCLQNVMAVGAGASALNPELRAPDGQILFYSDVCNRQTGEQSGSHCGSCVSVGSFVLDAVIQSIVNSRPRLEDSEPIESNDVISRPEMAMVFRRGPPKA